MPPVARGGGHIMLREAKRTVAGTELVCCEFESHVFVLATQINKVGSVLKAWGEPKLDGGTRYFVESLLGRRDDPLLCLYARQLVEQFDAICPQKPLILAISLSEEGRDGPHFQAVVNAAVEMLTELH